MLAFSPFNMFLIPRITGVRLRQSGAVQCGVGVSGVGWCRVWCEEGLSGVGWGSDQSSLSQYVKKKKVGKSCIDTNYQRTKLLQDNCKEQLIELPTQKPCCVFILCKCARQQEDTLNPFHKISTQPFLQQKAAHNVFPKPLTSLPDAQPLRNFSPRLGFPQITCEQVLTNVQGKKETSR